MKIITVATDLTHPFLVRLLNPSCEAVDLELVVLHPEQSAYQFADKRRMLAEQLLRVAARDELVVVTDAYDALFIRGQRHIEAGYERYDQPVVFSGELNSWPLGPVGMALHPGPPAGRYPYINTGGLIGPAGDIHDLCVKYAKAPTDQFELLVHLQAHGYRYHEQFSWSDQYHWTLVSLLEREMVGIDHDAAMFECFGPVIPDVVYSEVMRDVHDFAERGVESDAYQRERDELLARLEVPSGAAHLHFAGSITKAATLEFLDTEQLPEWLSVAHAAGPTPVRPGQIVRI
ncbi:glycosyltransferase domain-containing protein [Microbispora sp. H10670]|uniref:glycosyltransferase domain-containing protein n=1 Tax=Microbispora sp. H10670 TaxID=2729108 RepID=UPI0015FF9139|nr:glycosyltransferase domain-containing protein [Microbispora sp. H10670]